MTSQELLAEAVRLDQAGLEEEAELAYRKLLTADGNSDLVLCRLGSMALERRDLAAAIDYFRSSAGLREDPGTYCLLGVSLARQGNTIQAEEAYQQALRIDPDYEEALYNLGVLLRDDRPSEARLVFARAVELDPLFACAHRELGFLLSKFHGGKQAETHLLRAIDLDANDQWAYIYLGTHLWKQLRVESALSVFEQARDLFPEWAVPWWSLGNIQEMALKNFDLAQANFEQALILDPEDAEALCGIDRLAAKRLKRSRPRHS